MKKQSIRKYLLLAAACTMTGLLLSGCTSTQSGSLNNSTQAPSSSGSVSSQSSAADGSQSQDQGSGGEITLPSADGQQGSAASDSGQSASSSSAASGQTSAAQDDGSQSQPDIATYDEQNQNGADPKAQNSSSQNSSDEGVEEFTGTFSKADKSESVALTLDNDTSLNFSFQVCGIHGTAKASGNTAVYNGDDNYTISFAVAGDTLTVTVGGDDAESSSINGTYVRNPDTEAEYADNNTQND